MPKELKAQQPTSSIAHLLDPNSMAAATEAGRAKPTPGTVAGTMATPEIPPPPEIHLEPTGEPANIPRQFQLTRTADKTFKRLVQEYSDAVAVELSNAEVFRAVLHAVHHAMPMLIREAKQLEPQRRFQKSRGHEAHRDRLERMISQAFVAGMRAAAAME